MAEPSDPQPSLTRAHAVDWGRVTPVVHLFRCFRVAMQPSKIAVSWVAVMVVWLCSLALLPTGGSALRPADAGLTELGEQLAGESEMLGVEPDRTPLGRALGLPEAASGWLSMGAATRESADSGGGPAASVGLGPHPAAEVASAAAGLGVGGGWPAWVAVAASLIAATVVGLGVCRMAAARLCTSENIGPVAAAGFVARKGPWALLAPVVPGVVVVGIGLALTLLGLLLFSLPWADVLGGLLFGPMLLAGLAAAVVVAALLLSYPLMAAAVAVEGTDAFDTMSRCFAYLTAKPWAYLFYVAVASAYGLVCFAFLWLLVEGGVRLAVGFLELGAIGQPSELGEAVAYASGITLGGEASVSTAITGWLVWFWLVCLRALPLAFAFSFACTASTMIYLLLRRGADGTAFDDCDLIARREDPIGAAPLGEGTEAVTTPGSQPETANA